MILGRPARDSLFSDQAPSAEPSRTAIPQRDDVYAPSPLIVP
jgi:hypothetical protein